MNRSDDITTVDLPTNWEVYASDAALYLECTPSTIPGDILSAALRIAGDITRKWRKQTNTNPEDSDQFSWFFLDEFAKAEGITFGHGTTTDVALSQIAYWDCLEVC